MLLLQGVQVAPLNHIPRFKHLLQKDTSFSISLQNLLNQIYTSESFNQLDQQKERTGTKRSKTGTTKSMRPIDQFKQIRHNLMNGVYKDGLYDIDPKCVESIRFLLKQLNNKNDNTDTKTDNQTDNQASAAINTITNQFEQKYT